MKRFTWPLQRLLDVKIQKEESLRDELAKLQQELARLRREIQRRREVLSNLARELDGQALEHRLPRQQVFLRQLPVEQAVIEKLSAQCAAVEAARARKMAELLAERSSRKTLEQLREKRLVEYHKMQNDVEQKQLDEVAQGAHVRKGTNTVKPLAALGGELGTATREVAQ